VLEKITKSRLFITWTNWEYLPIYIANIPVVLIWLWFALRARRLFFFSAVNPVIETGGVLGESKYDILKRIPRRYLPKTAFIQTGTPAQQVLEKATQAGIVYPMLAKPNIGERGFLVKKIEHFDELEEYVAAIKVDFLVQEFVGERVEMSVLAHRFPDAKTGEVTSVCLKKFMAVTGDGVSTVEVLMAKDPRSILQIERLQAVNSELLKTVPPSGEKILLEPIGNHCRGTTFLNGNHLIDNELHTAFSKILLEMDGIFYGRFDLKCRDFESLKKGNLMVLEFNGVAGEPAHIYDPSYPVWKKYRDVYRHWGIIYRIFLAQKKRGVRAMNLREAWRSLRDYFRYKDNASVST
jgi:hypothetical protein